VKPKHAVLLDPSDAETQHQTVFSVVTQCTTVGGTNVLEEHTSKMEAVCSSETV
jgi:heptaprenylglyceryl phosphate synthase